MNNVNSQEVARAVTADGKALQQGSASSHASGSQAAIAGDTTGKSLPVADTRAPQANASSNAQAAAQKAERVEQAVSRLNDYVQSTQRDLRFAVDTELGRPIVTVIDRQTQKVIRQIPNETAVKLARNLNHYLEQASQEYTGGNAGSVERDVAQSGVSLGLVNTRI